MIGPVSGIAVVLATLAAFLWVGVRTRTSGLDVEEYLLARDSQHAGRLGLSFLASGLGAWILFAPPEIGAFVGAVAVGGYALGSAAPFALLSWLGRRMRAVAPAGHSLAEFTRVRFGRGFHALVVLASAGYMVLFLTAELTAVGAVAALLGGVDPRVTVLAVAATTLAYTAYGGLPASLRTDRWQAWLILGLLAAAAVAVVTVAPDVDRDVAAQLLTLDRVGFEVAITLIIAVTAANLFHQGYWQRVWAAAGERALAGGAALGAGMTIPAVALVGALGLLAAARGLDLGDPPAPVFALLAELPAWAAAGALVLGVALVASSVDTLENGLASLVAAERPRTSLASARLVTVALMIPAVAVALQGYSVLRLFLIADLVCAAVVVPALLGLWPRATSAGAVAGGLAGLAGAVLPGWVTTGSLAQGLELATFPGAVPTLPPFAGALLASTVVTVAVSLAGRSRTDLQAVGEAIAARHR